MQIQDIIFFVVIGIIAFKIIEFFIIWSVIKALIRDGVEEAINNTIIYQWKHQYNELQKQQQQQMMQQGRGWQ